MIEHGSDDFTITHIHLTAVALNIIFFCINNTSILYASDLYDYQLTLNNTNIKTNSVTNNNNNTLGIKTHKSVDLQNNLVTIDYYIPYDRNDVSYEIHVREKYFKDYNNHHNHYIKNNKHKPILFLLNSFGIPALEAFDLKTSYQFKQHSILNTHTAMNIDDTHNNLSLSKEFSDKLPIINKDYSIMNNFAILGYDVWSIDFIGEGSSSYFKEMSVPPIKLSLNIRQQNQLLLPLSSNEAVEQLNFVITQIPILQNQANATNKINLLGWSWGSVVMAKYAILYSNKINKLIFYGAMHANKLDDKLQELFIKPFNDGMYNYQIIPWNIVLHHWTMMNNNLKPELSNELANMYGTLDIKNFYANISDITNDADNNDINNKNDAMSIRRPNGPMYDLYNIWQGIPVYDITKINNKSLVIYGKNDFFADHKLSSKLSRSSEVIIPHATHWLIYEAPAKLIFLNTVNNFLMSSNDD